MKSPKLMVQSLLQRYGVMCAEIARDISSMIHKSEVQARMRSQHTSMEQTALQNSMYRGTLVAR